MKIRSWIRQRRISWRMGKVAGESAHSITWWQHFPNLKEEEYGRDFKTLLRTRGLTDGSCYHSFSTSFCSSPLFHCKHTHCLKHGFTFCFITQYCCYCGDCSHLSLLHFFSFFSEILQCLMVIHLWTFYKDFEFYMVAELFLWTHIWSYKLFSKTSCTLWSPPYWQFQRSRYFGDAFVELV